jgi:hypothetical protein
MSTSTLDLSQSRSDLKHKIASIVFLVTGILTGLGCFGHSLGGIQQIYEGLAGLPIAPRVVRLIYAVWDFAGVCMAVFGIIIVWIWFRVKKGELNLLSIPLIISVFYMLNGVVSVWYIGDLFFLIFVALGGSLFISSLVLKRADPGASG